MRSRPPKWTLNTCCLLVGCVRVLKGETAEFDGQVSAKHTVEVVDALTLDFENISPNSEHGTGNVRHAASHMRPDVDVQAQTRLELCVQEENEMAHTVKVVVVSTPRLEMRVSVGACITGGGLGQ
jgi:hypothetical protein